MGLLRIAQAPVVTVTPQTTVIQAVRTMDQEGIGAVAVIDKGILCGIFSERDVMLRVVLQQRGLERASHQRKFDLTHLREHLWR